LAKSGALLVGRRERRGGEVDLAADVKAPFHRLAQREGNRFDGPQIARDVLADEAVAARSALHELSILVREVDREAVDLQLADVVDVVAAEELADPLVERLELLLVERVR